MRVEHTVSRNGREWTVTRDEFADDGSFRTMSVVIEGQMMAMAFGGPHSPRMWEQFAIYYAAPELDYLIHGKVKQ